jgi:uncharacterized membrane-anchored protein
MRKTLAIVLMLSSLGSAPAFAESAKPSVEKGDQTGVNQNQVDDIIKITKEIEALPWVRSPAKVAITNRANLALEKDIGFLDATGSASYLKLSGNLPDGENYILRHNEIGWWAVYNFSDIGYVKDDEKIDADALLEQLKAQDEFANEERKNLGMEPLTTKGWAVAPYYDPQTKFLEYGLIVGSSTGDNINYRMRILGRRGVMDATLVTTKETLQTDLASFRQANKAFAFNPTESYAAYTDGDAVSEYGLAALVSGGAVAVAAKKGLFAGLLILLAKFWKLIAIGVVVFGAAIKRFFGRSKNEEEEVAAESDGER